MISFGPKEGDMSSAVPIRKRIEATASNRLLKISSRKYPKGE